MSKIITITDDLKELDESILVSVIEDLITCIENIAWDNHIDQDEVVDSIATVMEDNYINYDIEEVDI